jgi:hypothetical protein
MREAHEHLTPREVKALLEPHEDARGNRRVAAAAFLAEGCRACWTAVESGAPTEVTPASPSPIREAMVRIVSPGSWPAISADHLDAVLESRRRPFGFVFLVAEEAALAATPEPLTEATNLAALLAMRHGHPALGAVLARLYAIRAEAHVARGERSKAKEALTSALSCVGRDDEAVDVGTRIRLFQAQARFAQRFAQSGSPALFYREALALAGASPMRQLELTVELVSLPGWQPADAVERVTRALHATRALRSSPDEVVRAQALYRSARLLATAVDDDLGGLRVPDVVAEIADELEAAEDLLAAVADPFTRALVDQCLGELRFLHAPARAGEPLHRALETFVKAGASRLVQGARDALADLEKLLAMTGPQPGCRSRPPWNERGGRMGFASTLNPPPVDVEVAAPDGFASTSPLAATLGGDQLAREPEP